MWYHATLNTTTGDFKRFLRELIMGSTFLMAISGVTDGLLLVRLKCLPVLFFLFDLYSLSMDTIDWFGVSSSSLLLLSFHSHNRCFTLIFACAGKGYEHAFLIASPSGLDTTLKINMELASTTINILYCNIKL